MILLRETVDQPRLDRRKRAKLFMARLRAERAGRDVSQYPKRKRFKRRPAANVVKTANLI